MTGRCSRAPGFLLPERDSGNAARQPGDQGTNLENGAAAFLHPTRARHCLSMGRKQVSRCLTSDSPGEVQLKQDIFLAELSVKALMRGAVLNPSFKPLPRYPSVYRDLAFTISETISAGDILQTIKECGGELLEDARLLMFIRATRSRRGM